MWFATDLLWPSKGLKSVERSAERIVEKSTSDTLAVQVAAPGALTRGLNESGWVADEVIAAGMLRQGTPPSPLALVTGMVLVQMARARRSTALPREFVLAVTADRVLAFAMSPWKQGDAITDSGAAVRIKPGERGSWPRGSIRLTDLHKRVGMKGGTLQLAGVEPFPVTCESDPSTGELIQLLNR